MSEAGVYQYEQMPKAVLIEHCEAYSRALHELANEVQKLRIRLHIKNKNEEK